MSRHKKDQMVGEIEHASGVRVALMFNPNNNPNSDRSLTFSATVGDQEFRAKSADEVRCAVLKHLNDQANLEWVPVIEVQPVAPFSVGRGDAFVGLAIQRYYLANTPDPQLIRQIFWNDYHDAKPGGWHSPEHGLEMNRIECSKEFHAWHGDVKTSLPHHEIRHHDRATHYLPYDEATWTGLQQIAEGINRLKGWLGELVGTDDGLARITEAGAKFSKLLADKQ